MEKVKCVVSGEVVSHAEAIRGDFIRDSIYEQIRKDHPAFERKDFISLKELIPYRKKYVTSIIAEEFGELDKLENEVIDAVAHDKFLSANIEEDIDEKITLGQRMADNIASFGGSWTFIIFFFSFIIIWMGVNVIMVMRLGEGKAFDNYPFILLNLILSCLAAIQAPIIMMSQNRKEQKDRRRSEQDYKINLKAELEIKMLHEKLDHLMIHQNKRLLEIQEVQAEYLEDILKEVKIKK